MPYQQIEPIHERKGEKVAFMLTAENMVGLLIGAMPIYLLSGSLPFWLRGLLIVLGAAIGVTATLEIGGLTPAERLTWWARGMLRLRLQGNRLAPDQLPGAAPLRRVERALPLRGPIQVLASGPAWVARRSAPSVSQARHARTPATRFDPPAKE
jgi:hypothetical protein